MAVVQATYSSIKVFQTCAFQYLHKYILKDVKDPPGEAAAYGIAVHKAFELYFKHGTPIPPQFQQHWDKVAFVDTWPGDTYAEHRMAIGFDFKPCEFFDKNYFIRGVADLIKVDGKHARVLDWKLGKSAKYADLKQLEMMALLIFRLFPEVEIVTGGLVFLVPNKIIKAKYLRSDSKALWSRWLYEISRIESAIDSNNFGPTPNGLCKRFCPVLQCSFNERNYA